jgi:hypothetical protein
MKNWLDKYSDDIPQAQNGIEGTMAGLTDRGFNSNGAWGGQFQMGGNIYPVNYVPQAQIGASLPGASGMMYARQGAPSNGKKTIPSAQDGFSERSQGLTKRDNIKTFKPIQEKDRVLTKAEKEEIKQAALAEKRGDIKKYTPQSTFSKTKEIALNPLTAFGYVARNENLPENFSRSEDTRNILDNAIDFVNPSFYVDSAINVGENQAQVFSDLSQGNFGDAALSQTMAGVEALNFIPIAKQAKKFAKNIPQIKTFKENLNYNNNINPIRNIAGEEIKPAFGYATRDNQTFVRSDLPERVKRFVQAHEDYHVYDFKKYPNASNSFLRRELPANLFPAIKDPIGFASTVKHSLTPERLSFYKNRLKDNFKTGGIIKDNNGYWNPDNWGKPVEIDSNQITMKGVNQPLLGISDEGDTQMMYPEEEYKFKGKKVTEFPIAKNGMRQEQKGLQNLDNLVNFTNYNKPTVGGWLDKY